MRFHSYAPIGTTASTPSSDSGISAETRRIAAVDDGHGEDVSENVSQTVTTPPGTVNADVVVTETTTTKTTSKPVNGENVNVGMNIGGVSMGINMNVSGMDVEENSSTTVTTTTTTKTSTSGTVKEPVREPLPRKEVVNHYRVKKLSYKNQLLLVVWLCQVLHLLRLRKVLQTKDLMIHV